MKITSEIIALIPWKTLYIVLYRTVLIVAAAVVVVVLVVTVVVLIDVREQSIAEGMCRAVKDLCVGDTAHNIEI